MGDRMYVHLVVGPLTESQKTRLPEVMSDFCRDLGLDYMPEPFPGDSDRLLFKIEEVNYGLDGLGTISGRLEFLIDENMPYRVTDDGGSYANGSDTIWHPDFGLLAPLNRQANHDMKVVLTEDLIGRLAGLDDDAFAATIRGLVKTDPSDPDLAETVRFLAEYLPTT